MALGRALVSEDASWLFWVQVGQLQSMESRPDQSVAELSLEVLRRNHAMSVFLDDQVAKAVHSARRERVSWSEIGTVVGVSKQTAHSRWGSVVETRGGENFVMDIMRDRELPLARITSETPALANAVRPTAGHRELVVATLGLADKGQADQDRITLALVTLAYNLATASDKDWNNTDEQQHFLGLALRMAGSDAGSPR